MHHGWRPSEEFLCIALGVRIVAMCKDPPTGGPHNNFDLKPQKKQRLEVSPLPPLSKRTGEKTEEDAQEAGNA